MNARSTLLMGAVIKAVNLTEPTEFLRLFSTDKD
jgi:hypothetical protein